MLMAHPVVLRNLVEHYESLEALARTEAATPQMHRQLNDLAYTLCVSTGTQDVRAALEAAYGQLGEAFTTSGQPAAVA